MKHEVLTGQTDYTVLVFIPDSASTDGSGKTGLVAANLTVSGVRVETDNDVTVIDYTASLNNLAALTTAHTDWGLLEVSSTLAPGLYRLDIADALFATGAWSCVVYVMVTTSASAASPMEFVMVPTAPVSGVTTATYTGDTPQTGDNFARIGATGSGLTSLASQASVTTIDDFLDTEIAAIITTLGTPSNLGSGATVAGNLVDIEAQTDDIGTAGAGLTAVPWNAAWDAEVQSEATDALNAYDPPTNAELVTEINSVQTDIAALNNLASGAAMTLTAGERTSIAAALAATVVDTQGSYTVQQVLSIVLAAVAGVTSASGATLKTPNGVSTRIAATVNASNERTAMTLTPSA